MKPDGVATTPDDPVEVLGAAEPVAAATAMEDEPQADQTQSPPQPEETKNEPQPEIPTEPPATTETSGKSTDPKGKGKATVKGKPGTVGNRTNGAPNAGSRPNTAQSRLANGVQRSSANDAAKKTSTTAAERKKPTSATGPTTPAKKPVGTAATTTSKTQTKVGEKKLIGVTRPPTTSSAPNGAKTATGPGTPTRRPPTGNAAAATKPKTTAPRTANATASKPSAPAAPRAGTVPKTTRPATAPASRPAPSAATAKGATNTIRQPASSKIGTTAPSAGRTATVQPSKPSATSGAAKRDVSKPPTSAPAKKLAAPSTRPLGAKPSKPEPPKAVSSKVETAARRPPPTTRPVEPKTPRPKPAETKTTTIRKVPTSPRNAASKPGLSKTSAASPGPKQATKQPSKPMQSVQPLAREPDKESTELAAAAAAVATAAIATAVAVAASSGVPEVEAALAVGTEAVSGDQTSLTVARQEAAESQVPMTEVPGLEPVSPAEPATVEIPTEAAAAQVGAPPVVSPPAAQALSPDQGLEDVTEKKETSATQEAFKEAAFPFELPTPASVPPVSQVVVEKAEQEINNDDEEEEEEKEGSQQVSVSDMSGTQPTEESRPGSAGVAGSMWRAGALLSEFDSEDVSCSQQGASELSAPGVLEGTESMDDLGDASLKGADGEGVSAGSPDFEKVPDIPANEDEEDEDEDDEDRVCDMEVGSERAEDPRQQRQDGDDEEEDEDVEMASEGVTESGLESYGNADEDDFAEDYKLDNLNRVQPPPVIPTAPPAAQWAQTNPFADSWAQPPQSASMFLSSPTSDPWQGDSETPTQSPAQAWLEMGSSEGGSSSPHPPAQTEPSSKPPESTTCGDTTGCKPGLVPPTRGMSQSSTLSGTELAAHSSSDTSTPEELKEYNSNSGVEIHSEGHQQQPTPVPNELVPGVVPDIVQDLAIHEERIKEEEEPETLPADEVLGGTGTAPTSAPSSSSSATEDEVSETEGEMQISEPQVGICNEGFEAPPATHSLSALEEHEEMGGEVEGGSDTPQSATSAASYGFDCTTSNSNAHSMAESCGKSPGIFSLENEEQLPEEAKDPSLIKELTLTSESTPEQPVQEKNLLNLEGEEQHYMQCGKAGEELPESCSIGALPLDPGMVPSSSPQHPAQDQDQDTQPPYYSAICEKTDSSLAGNV
ncbi:mucin-5AC isoform X2 [Chanos chanos]|uniref:Mucin-5AC isoform X2 n=1 Tax=Chanos chanos TaxID=29144 RepID=A0A6J2VTF5_CHACN|nr:mucin-5AC-like isoform X2 [Chanos chanos]